MKFVTWRIAVVWTISLFYLAARDLDGHPAVASILT